MTNIRLMRGREIVKELQMDDLEMNHPVYEEPLSIIIKRGNDVIKTISNVRETVQPQKRRQYSNNKHTNTHYGKVENGISKKDETKSIVSNNNDTNVNINIDPNDYYGIKNNFIPKPNNIKSQQPIVKGEYVEKESTIYKDDESTKIETSSENIEVIKDDESTKIETSKSSIDKMSDALGVTTEVESEETKVEVKSSTDDMVQKYIEEYDDVEYDNFEKINKSKNLDLY